MDGEVSIGGGDNEEGDVTLNLSGNGGAITDAAVRAVAKALGARLRGITLFESPSLSDVALDTLSTCSGQKLRYTSLASVCRKCSAAAHSAGAARSTSR